MSADDQKRAVGEAAAAVVQPGMKVGLGTGSTAAWFIKTLAKRGLDIVCAATSQASTDLAVAGGLRVIDIDEIGRLDLTVDGADEIGPGLALIKGAGGALFREKLVWESSDRCLVIADAAKAVTMLGAFPLSIEVVPFGWRQTARRIENLAHALGLAAALEPRRTGDDFYLTDNGNVVLDLACGAIPDPANLALGLKGLTGVVEHGLFLGLAHQGLLGTDAGVETIWP